MFHSPTNDFKDDTRSDMTEEIATPADNQESLPTDLASLTEEVIELRALVENLTGQVDAYQTDFLRARADFQNLKRRTEEEREQLKAFLIEGLLKKLLPVMDNFERALAAAEQTQDYEKLIGGIGATYKQFSETLLGEGLSVIAGGVGVAFDPNLHNAVMRDESNEFPDNSIVEELQKGYLLGGKVLRPTLVKVAIGG